MYKGNNNKSFPLGTEVSPFANLHMSDSRTEKGEEEGREGIRNQFSEVVGPSLIDYTRKSSGNSLVRN